MKKGTKSFVYKPVFIMSAAITVCLMILLVICTISFSKQMNPLQNEREYLQIICPKLTDCGDAFLLRSGEEGVLIDSGVKNDEETILNLLKENHITSLEALILTHFDKDHIGSAAAVLREIPVKKCYLTIGSEDSEEYEALKDALSQTGTSHITLINSYTFRALGAEFTMYTPRAYGYEKDTDNNRSLITRISYKGKNLLFAADAQEERMEEFVEHQYDGTVYDFVKVPHHGKSPESLELLLKMIHPKHALITASEEEVEDPKTLQILEKSSVSTWFTREDSVMISLTEQDFQIQQGKKVCRIESSQEEKHVETTNSENKENTNKENTAENTENLAVEVAEPVFSKDSGFYSESFPLSIQAPEGTKVYYTIGSETPTIDSTEYTGEFMIKDASSNPNVYCNYAKFWAYRMFTPVAGEPQIPGLNGYYSRYETTKKLIDKCVIVRAIAVDEKGNTSKVKTASYFIGYDQKSGYDNLSVMSIVSDPDNLFSDEKGIMVNGPKYNQAMKSGELRGVTDILVIREYMQSYKGRGPEWEREAHIDYFGEEEKDLVFSQEVGIRLHGNMNRIGYPQKSFNLYARKKYGNKTFLQPFFEDGLLQDKVTLLCGENVRGYYLSKLMNHRRMDTQNYRLIQVFLDGEYWGMYAIQERYNSKRYMKDHYSLSEEDYTLFSGKTGGFQVKNEKEDLTQTSLKIMTQQLHDLDMSDSFEYQRICSMMDVQSFIDDYAERLYTSDQDWSWYKNSFVLFSDNKWHWLVYDTDYGAGGHEDAMADNNPFPMSRRYGTHSLKTEPFFMYLWKNENFRKDFVNTFMDLSNDTFAVNRIRRDKESYLLKYGEAIEKELLRYPPLVRKNPNPKRNYFENRWDEMETFFRERPKYVYNYMKDFFHLEGTFVPIQLSIDDSTSGKVRINTITPEWNEEGLWKGTYFTGYPVEVTAIPAEGWNFVGWKCENGEIADQDSITTTVRVQEGTKIQPVFQKKE